MVCALMVQLVKVDKKTMFPDNVEKTIPPSWILEAVIALVITVLPVRVDTLMLETDRVEKVNVDSREVLA